MIKGRTAVILAVVALMLAGGLIGFVVVTNNHSNDAGQRETGSSTATGTGSAGSSAEASPVPGSHAQAKPGDQVPDATAYELIDALRAAGIAPTMGGTLTMDYVGTLDTVKVSGTFEGTSATSYVLVYEDGAWKLKE